MVKHPQVGRVKTRLGRDMGSIPATWWFRHQSAKLIRSLSADRRWKTVIAVAPDILGLQSRAWPEELERWPQGHGNLGDRMRGIFQGAKAGPVIIIGADIPNITPALIECAFRKLGQADAVFGPAPDGGYWLIGMRRSPRSVPNSALKNVRWSSPDALADSIKSLKDMKVELISELQDVDTLSDLKTLKP